jgi:hypothetical protein
MRLGSFRKRLRAGLRLDPPTPIRRASEGLRRVKWPASRGPSLALRVSRGRRPGGRVNTLVALCCFSTQLESIIRFVEQDSGSFRRRLWAGSAGRSARTNPTRKRRSPSGRKAGLRRIPRSCVGLVFDGGRRPNWARDRSSPCDGTSVSPLICGPRFAFVSQATPGGLAARPAHTNPTRKRRSPSGRGAGLR